MSLLSRIRNVFRGERVNREIDNELQSHLDEAVEAGRGIDDARRAFGSVLARREEIRDLRVNAWLDSLRADAVFGWRQIMKRKVASAAAILSLALAIGACTSAFRLIDALLLRPLPIANADRMYVIARQGVGSDGAFRISESCEYPLFRRMRDAVRDQAELIAVSYADRVDLTYGSDEEMEKAHRQYVSGSMFETFGLRPAIGRLLREEDDRTPGAHPYVVLSHEYWTRRFAEDPKVVGWRVRIGSAVFEIAGVIDGPFTGTEPGTAVDIFLPAMMQPNVMRSDSSWFRPLAVLKPAMPVEPVRARLRVIFDTFQEERANAWKSQSKLFRERFLAQTLLLERAGSGTSAMQKDYRRALTALGTLVALVLLIACANVANLMLAQAASRAREMALRVSIGAGRWRLIQLVLIESAWIGFLAAVLGGLFAWQSAPVIVRWINPPDNPAYLALPADWRALSFGFALALAVTMLFGLVPALRASSVQPISALKGGEDSRHRPLLMHALIALQVGFCFVVHFAAGLFVTTFERLAHQSTGFATERLVVLETATQRPQPPAVWDQVVAHLRDLPGVDGAALSGWPLLSGTGWNGSVWVGGVTTDVSAYFLAVSPDWIQTMGIPLLDGRNLRLNDTGPSAVLVNEAFVKQCFGGINPIGKSFEKATGDGVTWNRYQVVGIVGNARYRNMREPITPTAYVPFHTVDAAGTPRPTQAAAIVVRTSRKNPAALIPMLRPEVSRAHSEFRVSNARTQVELVQQHTVRERLLAILAMFFAGVAVILAGVGLYGVLDYSVLQRRREIGIRLAIGAGAADIARRVTSDVLMMVCAGTVGGLGLGMASLRYVEALLYEVKPTDVGLLAAPILTIIAAALLAAVPAILRAVQIDPVSMLRSD
ncbi:MAG: ABC transporter permease [Bryobacteraceae bacterium]